ncbi:MAG: class I SAM-dependent methyltransferase, partial [Alphaproteobacteria bacterium]
MRSSAMDLLDDMKPAMRLPWTTGDFGALSRLFGQRTADEFVSSLDALNGLQVLDVACGTGGATLPLARRVAQVTGIDLAPNLLHQAEIDARAAGLEIRFDEGFAEELPYDDASFDLATSLFGVIFSPFPDRIVSELHRVVRPGGRVAITSWTPGSFSERSRAATATFMPQMDPAGPRPFAWGDAEAVGELL